MTIALNIVLATLVIVGIVGMLAWSIASQNVDAAARLLPLGRRRHTTARAGAAGGRHVVGRTAQNRA